MGTGIDRDAWNAFCDATPAAWWWHRREWIDYQVARGAEDLSVAWNDGTRLIGIAPMLRDSERKAILVEGHPGPSPVGVWPTIPDTYARVAFRSSAFTVERITPPPGWTEWSWQTQVIDLRPATLDLWAGVRKSYHSLINHVEKTHEIVVDERGKLLDAFRQVHAHEAGRETRPRATWDMMADWCLTGNGLHVCAILGGVVVACVYFEVYKRCAYFGHAAAYHKNVTHALVWRGMQELKLRGVTQLEMGWLDYPGEEGRAVFKSGFGGEARTVYAVERRR